LKKLKEVNYGSLATVVGRYYAMDRDKRWERIKIAYEALVQGKGEVTSPDKVIEVNFNIQIFFFIYFLIFFCTKVQELFVFTEVYMYAQERSCIITSLET